MIESDELTNVILKVVKGEESTTVAIDTLTTFCDELKRVFVPLDAAHAYFEALSLAQDARVSQADVEQFRIVSLNALCSLTENVASRDPSYLLNSATIIMPWLVDNLDCDFVPVVIRSLECMWLACPTPVEETLREYGLSHSRAGVRELCLQVISNRIQDLDGSFAFRKFTPKVAQLLVDTDGSVRKMAYALLVQVFASASPAACADLNRVMRLLRIPDAVQTRLNSRIKSESSIIGPHSEVSPVNSPSEPGDPMDPSAFGDRSGRSSPPSMSKLSGHSAYPQNVPEAEKSDSIPSTFDLEVVRDPQYPLQPLDSKCPIQSEDYLYQELDELMTCFDGKETEFNWLAREKTLIQFRQVLRVPSHDISSEAKINAFRQVQPGILVAISSLRTTLVMNACHAIKDAFQLLGGPSDLTESFMAPLSRVASGTKRITATLAHVTVCAILLSTNYSSKYLATIKAAINDPKPQLRAYGIIWTHVLLVAHQSRASVLLRPGTDIELWLIKTLQDASPVVRKASRDLYWIIQALDSNSSRRIHDKLDSSAAKSLERSMPKPQPVSPSTSNTYGQPCGHSVAAHTPGSITRPPSLAQSPRVSPPRILGSVETNTPSRLSPLLQTRGKVEAVSTRKLSPDFSNLASRIPSTGSSGSAVSSRSTPRYSQTPIRSSSRITPARRSTEDLSRSSSPRGPTATLFASNAVGTLESSTNCYTNSTDSGLPDASNTPISAKIDNKLVANSSLGANEDIEVKSDMDVDTDTDTDSEGAGENESRVNNNTENKYRAPALEAVGVSPSQGPIPHLWANLDCLDKKAVLDTVMKEHGIGVAAMAKILLHELIKNKSIEKPSLLLFAQYLPPLDSTLPDDLDDELTALIKSIRDIDVDFDSDVYTWLSAIEGARQSTPEELSPPDISLVRISPLRSMSPTRIATNPLNSITSNYDRPSSTVSIYVDPPVRGVAESNSRKELKLSRQQLKSLPTTTEDCKNYFRSCLGQLKDRTISESALSMLIILVATPRDSRPEQLATQLWGPSENSKTYQLVLSYLRHSEDMSNESVHLGVVLLSHLMSNNPNDRGEYGPGLISALLAVSQRRYLVASLEYNALPLIVAAIEKANLSKDDANACLKAIEDAYISRKATTKASKVLLLKLAAKLSTTSSPSAQFVEQSISESDAGIRVEAYPVVLGVLKRDSQEGMKICGQLTEGQTRLIAYYRENLNVN